jgi:hypothetical protein
MVGQLTVVGTRITVRNDGCEAGAPSLFPNDKLRLDIERSVYVFLTWVKESHSQYDCEMCQTVSLNKLREASTTRASLVCNLWQRFTNSLLSDKATPQV